MHNFTYPPHRYCAHYIKSIYNLLAATEMSSAPIEIYTGGRKAGRACEKSWKSRRRTAGGMGWTVNELHL